MLKGSKEWCARMSSAAAAFLLEYRATRVRKRKKRKKGRKKGRKREGESRAKKKRVRTSDDFFGKHEFARRLMKKKGGNNNFVARYTVMESRADVMRNPAN